ncbi:hypothetical protein D3C84_190940 [compost metagenome]
MIVVQLSPLLIWLFTGACFPYSESGFVSMTGLFVVPLTFTTQPLKHSLQKILMVQNIVTALTLHIARDLSGKESFRKNADNFLFKNYAPHRNHSFIIPDSKSAIYSL